MFVNVFDLIKLALIAVGGFVMLVSGILLLVFNKRKAIAKIIFGILCIVLGAVAVYIGVSLFIGYGLIFIIWESIVWHANN